MPEHAWLMQSYVELKEIKTQQPHQELNATSNVSLQLRCKRVHHIVVAVFLLPWPGAQCKICENAKRVFAAWNTRSAECTHGLSVLTTTHICDISSNTNNESAIKTNTCRLSCMTCGFMHERPGKRLSHYTATYARETWQEVVALYSNVCFKHIQNNRQQRKQASVIPADKKMRCAVAWSFFLKRWPML